MKSILAFLLFTVLSFELMAQKAVSLNEAVKQAESQGRVISARTVRDKHEVRVLTASGAVKTINIDTGESAKNKPPRLDNYSGAEQPMRDRRNNPVIPQRYNGDKRQKRTIKLDSRQLEGQSRKRLLKSNNRNNSKKKDR